jgi:hypothetical protein
MWRDVTIVPSSLCSATVEDGAKIGHVSDSAISNDDLPVHIHGRQFRSYNSLRLFDVTLEDTPRPILRASKFVNRDRIHLMVFVDVVQPQLFGI